MKKERVKEIMSKVFEMNIEDLKDDTNQKNTPRWDSLRHLTLIVELEDEFGVSFEPEEIGSMDSIDAVLLALEKNTR